MSTKDALNFLALGRGELAKGAPYISTTIYGLTPQPVEGIGTMAVTPGLVLYFDPDWLLSEPSFQMRDNNGRDIGYKVLAGCIYHECCHILRDLNRLEVLANKELANIAADLAINSNLREAGWLLPPWVCYPESFGLPDGLTLEQYYHLLDKQQQSGGKNKQSGQGQKGGKGQAGGAGQPHQHKVGGGCCGGIAHNPGAHEALEKSLDETVGKHEAEVEVIKRITAQRTKEYQEANGRGSTPGFDADEVLFAKKPPVINWPREIHRVIRITTGRVIPGGDDYSLARPSRRSMLLGPIRPGLIKQETELAFIRDTSGSMGEDDLNEANNEIIHAMKRCGIDEVWLLDADTQVHGKPRKVRVRDIPKMQVKGRGGTDFRAALTAVAKIKPRPDVAVYMTDGDGTAPVSPPKGFQVIWCVIPGHSRHKPASWGYTVICSNDPAIRKQYQV